MVQCCDEQATCAGGGAGERRRTLRTSGEGERSRRHAFRIAGRVEPARFAGVWNPFARTRAPRSFSEMPFPWGARVSIYAHLQAHRTDDGPGRGVSGRVLPDEHPHEGDKVRWAPGALDGVLGHHAGQVGGDVVARRILDAISASVVRRSSSEVAKLYEMLRSHSAMEYVDPLLEAIRAGERQVDADGLHALAHWLATMAPDREVVKVAIGLLGCVRGYEDMEVLLTLGSHEEFTVFVAVALRNTIAKPDRVLWRLAQSVDGWGRIQTVERLRDTSDPEIKGWLLRDGYRNSVMDEYLAYTCAMAGEAHVALATDAIDHELFVGVGGIIDALIVGGPAESIRDYEHAQVTVERYVRHSRSLARTPRDLTTLKQIEQLLEEDDRTGGERTGHRFHAEVGARLVQEIREIAARPGWRAIVETDLLSNDDRDFHAAAHAARWCDVDPWPHHLRRIEDGRADWYWAMQTDHRDRAAAVVELAERKIDLAKVATGPSGALGLGPDYAMHSAIDFIVQDLRRFPGLGDRLIEAALRSPVIRNRNMALNALAAWPRELWSDRQLLLERCRDDEPDPNVRRRFENLLAGKPLDEA